MNNKTLTANQNPPYFNKIEHLKGQTLFRTTDVTVNTIVIFIVIVVSVNTKNDNYNDNNISVHINAQ